MTIYEKPVAFTYAIHWTKQNKSYYGVRYAEGCTTGDMWKTYFTSSKHVAAFRREHGEPDLILIDQMFLDVREARAYEAEILTENRVNKNDDWLNVACDTSHCPAPKKGKDNFRHNPIILKLFNIITKEIIQGTQLELHKIVGGTRGEISMLANGHRAQVRGWFIVESQKAGVCKRSLDFLEALGGYDANIGSMKELQCLSGKFKNGSDDMRVRMSESRKGRLLGSKNPMADLRVYTFIHSTGEEFTGLRTDFTKYSGLLKQSVGNLIKGKTLVSGGWKYGEGSIS